MRLCLLALGVVATTAFAFAKESPGSPHIAGGEETAPHSIPHQVALYEAYKYICGGSLISDRWVLTAGHCADSEFSKYVIVGLHNLFQPEDTSTRVQVKESIIHDKYDPKNVYYDIALMKLERSVSIDGPNIRAIRLPRISQKDSSFFWSNAVMSGWGRMQHRYSQLSGVLRTATARILWGPYCKVYFWTNRPVPFNMQTHLCTSGSGNKGGCFGDSGGPLTLKENDGENTLIGVASFMYDNNCESGGPTAFIRVTQFLDWIHNHTDIAPRP